MKTGMTESIGVFAAEADPNFYDHFQMRKIYCACGCIMDLDRAYFKRRLDLGKKVECVHCRNQRISREIEELNNHFAGIPDDSEESLL